LAAKGLDTLGVIFGISANRDFGSGVIVAGVGIFRFAGVWGLIAAKLPINSN